MSFGKYTRLFTSLPTRSKFTLAILSMSLLSHFAGRRMLKRVREANLDKNLQNLQKNPQDWSCFYQAKQYHEECDDRNRQHGSEYMDKLCGSLEDGLKRCNDKLSAEIAACKPYAMDPPIALVNCPPWLSTGENCA